MDCNNKSDDDVLKLAEVCRIVGLSPPTVRKWIACGALPAVKRGRAWTVRRGDLVAMIDAGER